jgi:hypothetical protein
MEIYWVSMNAVERGKSLFSGPIIPAAQALPSNVEFYAKLGIWVKNPPRHYVKET